MTKLAELVLIPGPGRGHLAPALEFAKLAVARSDNLSITVLIMKLPTDPHFAAYVDSLVASFAPASGRLKFIDISQGIDAAMEGGPHLFLHRFVTSLKPRAKSAVEDNVVAARLAGFVLDMACVPMADVADELGVPNYVFWASSAGCLGLNFHLLGGDRTDRSSDCQSNSLILPCFANRVPAAVLPPAVFDAVFVSNIRRIRETKGVILNTSAELEPQALGALISGGSSPPVYSVGPIVSMTGGEASGASVMGWLDGQPPSSVLFLCFGSFGSLGGAQVREIASALEKTGFRFLWTLRKSPPKDKLAFSSDVCADPAAVLPEGFLDRTAEVGRVISWAPQAAVLSHRAVGGFVSHCGWNSLLESLWFGVPVAAWPLYAEQQLNAFEMVAELGLAVEVKTDYKAGFDTGIDVDEAVLVRSEEIESGMRRVMEGDSEVRKRVKEMSEKCKMGVVEGGSSHSSLGRFLSDVFANFSSN